MADYTAWLLDDNVNCSTNFNAERTNEHISWIKIKTPESLVKQPDCIRFQHIKITSTLPFCCSKILVLTYSTYNLSWFIVHEGGKLTSSLNKGISLDRFEINIDLDRTLSLLFPSVLSRRKDKMIINFQAGHLRKNILLILS